MRMEAALLVEAERLPKEMAGSLEETGEAPRSDTSLYVERKGLLEVSAESIARRQKTPREWTQGCTSSERSLWRWAGLESQAILNAREGYLEQVYPAFVRDI